MEKWYVKNIKADLNTLSKKTGASKLLCRLMVNRRLKDLNQMDIFINPNVNKLHDPYLMKDMDKGVDIIVNSIRKNEKIRVVGDYDQDGNSSILTLIKGLGELNANVDYVIPHRIKDGYGINERIVKEAKNDNVDLIITCDNGISAFEPVELARKLGIKIIITDHHDLSFKEENGRKEFLIPPAHAVINPKRWDCTYPFKELCGAGVAFKLIQALYKRENINMEKAYKLLEFVAMGTVCDVVDLVDENRIIVKEGLKMINSTRNIGLKALIKATGLDGKHINTYSLGFILGPCINASGRLDDAEMAVELFLTEDYNKAKYYAEYLHSLNEDRKTMTKKGFEEVVDKIEKSNIKNHDILVVYEPSIHESIAGIIAGRVKDKYYKPTIVLTDSQKEGEIKGSGRSIEEYNMFEEIYKLKYMLVSFGGHPMAAGLSLEKGNLDSFRVKLNQESKLTKDDLTPKVYMDMELPLEYVNFSLVEELEQLEPYGKGNPRPLFGEKNISVQRAFVLGSNHNVLKLNLLTKQGRIIEGIYFGDIKEFEKRLSSKYNWDEIEKMYKGLENDIKLDIVYTPNINEYMGRRTVQINIQNYR